MQVDQTLGNLEEADGHTYSGIKLKFVIDNTQNGDGNASMQLCIHSVWQRGFTRGVTGNEQLTSRPRDSLKSHACQGTCGLKALT